MRVKALIVDKNKDLFKKLNPAFENESIELLYTSDVINAQDIIVNQNVFIVIISCDVENSEEVVIASKANDLFRPIIVIGDDKLRKPVFYSMGVNVFYKPPVEIFEIITQSLNLITLYHAKKDSKSQNDVFKTLSTALEVRDPYTHGHGERVAIYATILYDALGFMDYEDRELLRIGCIIHDVGKIGTSDEILKSDRKLTDDEFEKIKNHPEDGVKICLNIISDIKVIDVIEHHHEKLDGSGYPEGLKGDEISHLVQMTTICDVYDALTSDRSYRIKNTEEEAVEIMQKYFVDNGKINPEYFAKFKTLLFDGKFDGVKLI